MNLKNYIKTYENIMSSEDCNNAIEEFEKDTHAQTSIGWDGPILTKKKLPWTKRFTEIDFRQNLNWQTMWGSYFDSALDHVVSKYRKDLNIDSSIWKKQEYPNEGYRMKKYEPKLDKFDLHVDTFDSISAVRFLSVFWYLNDVKEGGETHFSSLNYYVKPKQGSVLIFPPLWLFPHAGLAPISGSKYIIHTYLHWPTDNILEPSKSGAVKRENDINK